MSSNLTASAKNERKPRKFKRLRGFVVSGGTRGNQIELSDGRRCQFLWLQRGSPSQRCSESASTSLHSFVSTSSWLAGSRHRLALKFRRYA